MVGSDLPTPDTTVSTVTDVVELRIVGLTSLHTDGRVAIEDITFDIHRGEIVGIAGVEGNGQPQLVDTILGVRDAVAGALHLAGKDISGFDTKMRRDEGIGIIPEDRHRQGLLLDSPLWENAMLGHQSKKPFARGIWVDRTGARDITREIVERFDVRTPGVDVNAVALSGGNQQKLSVGKEWSLDPSVLIAAHPTRGMDVGAQAAVWEELRQARREGMAILLISADLEELIGLSDTLLVLFDGRIVAKLDPADVTPKTLGSHMTGVAVEEEAL